MLAIYKLLLFFWGEEPNICIYFVQWAVYFGAYFAILSRCDWCYSKAFYENWWWCYIVRCFSKLHLELSQGFLFSPSVVIVEADVYTIHFCFYLVSVGQLDLTAFRIECPCVLIKLQYDTSTWHKLYIINMANWALKEFTCLPECRFFPQWTVIFSPAGQNKSCSYPSDVLVYCWQWFWLWLAWKMVKLSVCWVHWERAGDSACLWPVPVWSECCADWATMLKVHMVYQHYFTGTWNQQQ